MTYAEFLKSQGASDDDIKVLDTPLARKAYDAQQAAQADAVTAAEQRGREAYKATADAWYNDQIVPEYTKTEAEMVRAKAEADRAKSVIRTMAARDAGLAQVAKDMGYDVDGTPPATPSGTPPPADGKKYLTLEDISGPLDQAGDGLAAMQDMVLEHMQLFPGQKLNVRELRREAQTNRKNVYQYWEEKYKVGDARTAAAKAAHDAEVAKWKAEGAKEKETELVSKYGNPDTRPMVASTSPFTQRSATADSARAGKQPWEAPGNSLEQLRIRKGVDAVMKQHVQ